MAIGKVEKLAPNLFKKKNYVVHIRTLNQVLKHGNTRHRKHTIGNDDTDKLFHLPYYASRIQRCAILTKRLWILEQFPRPLLGINGRL